MGKFRFTLPILWLLVWAGCKKPEAPYLPPIVEGCASDSITFGAISLSPSADMGLYIRAEFAVSLPARGRLVAWKPGSLDTLRSTESALGISHSVGLVGLEGNSEYVIRLEAGDGACWKMGPADTLVTAAIPATAPVFNLVSGDSTAFEGWILVNTQSVPGGIYLVNAKGNVVWYQQYAGGYSAFAPDGADGFVVLGGTDLVRRISLAGVVEQANLLPLPASDASYHHDLYAEADGGTVVLFKSWRTEDFTAYGGSAADNIICEEIRKFDPAGNLLWNWNLCDAVDWADYPNIVQDASDFGHANTVSPDGFGNYWVSFRNFNQIWKIDAATGAVVWKLGEHGDWNLPSNGIFYRQHSVHVSGHNRMMLFDNGDGINRATSRVLELKLDEQSRTATVELDLELPSRLFSNRMGSAYRMPNGRLLVCASDPMTVVVMDDSGDIIWELQSSLKPYRAIPFGPL